jgi:acyl-[acyl-carrier-protein]-phospholipid O-acyltransferase / long-chain-fatty-acid--[acyl-carrier-protein] ligase
MNSPDANSSTGREHSPDAAHPRWRRGFWSLIVTQFQGAFSDNALKQLVILIMLTSNLSQGEKHRVGELVGALFALPFILFSMWGGFLADRHSKRTISIGVKVFEIGIMLLALYGLSSLNLPVLFTCVFLMGMHSAFFGPSKYGLLPELLPEKRLSWGNGILELGTFTAIILGTVAASFLAEHFRGNQSVSGLILLGLAVAGLATSIGISRVPPADPQRRFKVNFLAEIIRQLAEARKDRTLSLALVGNTYFNFLGALVMMNVIFYGQEVLQVTETRIGFLNASLALGIGAGSVAAGYLSGGKIEYGLVPLGAAGLAATCSALAIPGLSLGQSYVVLAVMGFSGGFFIVPIMALLQHKPSREQKGALLALANWLSFVGVFLASGVHWLLTHPFAMTPKAIFFAGGILTLLGAIYALRLLPDALLRLLFWMLTHTLYRIRIEGRDNIPEKGGALFVCNHLSLADAIWLQAAVDRPIRFIMFKGMYDKPFIRPIARIMGAIPISSELRPRDMIKSLQTASEAIQKGEIVCIFAEGQITRIGQLLPFRRGFERIMQDVDAPIIPIALDGGWGSIFSFEEGKFLWKWPRRIPYPIALNFGPAMPKDSTPFAVREMVQQLQADAWKHRRDTMEPLQRAFIRTARKHPGRFAMADATTPGVNFGEALMRSVFLARRLRATWTGQGMVGLLLPPSVPGALVNYAALLSGKVPVNLNYTLSEEAIASCVKQCGITTIVTSKKFLEAVKLKLPGEVRFLEDLAANPSGGEKVCALLLAKLAPVGFLERTLRGTGNTNADPSPLAARGEGQGEGLASTIQETPLTRPADTLSPHPMKGEGKIAPLDHLATVIFSSGSTGEPKGVMLSHYNVGSNIEQLGQVFALTHKDRILGVLPFFHSFGFTGTLCLPAVLGVGVAYHANPLDAKTIGPLIQDNAVSFVLATPTFLQLYLRGCSPEHFGSVRLIMVGAEKLPDRLADAFEEKFGIRPVEGYGTTECAPAVTVNTHDFRAAGFRQVGAKRGKIGHPLPGMSVRIVDPDTREPVPMGQPGLLLVKGPNVMQGYLGKPEKTAEVLIELPSTQPGRRRREESLTEMGSAECGTRNDDQSLLTSAPTVEATGKWYVTGDIAALDEDGFLQITDRLSRFSKIGGEMVPHIKVEETLHELTGATEQTFAVTGVPDEKKGEKLVVLHKLSEDALKAVLEKLTSADLPNLWKPKADQFFRVDTLPYLGTGKLDLRKIRELATQMSKP